MQGQQQQVILLFYVVIIAVFYLLMIRPQRMQQRKRREMLSAVKRGDRVVTVGGLHATVADVKDEILSLDLAPNLRVKADRSAISYVRPKGDEPSKTEP
jgi:preprotein translocase subunit YajC